MRIKDIEKLRAMALLMVLFGHLPVAIPPLFIHGYTGVVLFFIISGYVCCLSFEKSISNYQKHPRIYATVEFYIARLFRVIPVILIWLLIYFVCAHFVNYLGGAYGDTVRFIKELGWWNSGLYNYHFAYSKMPGLFGHMWSMAIELQFYLFLPLFYLVLPTKKLRNIISICLIVLSFVFLAITEEDVSGKLTHTQMGSLFIGVFLYTNRTALKELQIFINKPILKKIITGACLIGIFILPYWLDGNVSSVIKYLIFYVIGGGLVYTAQLDTGWYPSSPKITAFLLKIASVSFSTYVSHILLFSCVYYNLYTLVLLPACPWLSTSGGIVLQVISLLCLSLFVGWLSSELIEKPYAVYGKKIIEKTRTRIQNMNKKIIGGC